MDARKFCGDHKKKLIVLLAVVCIAIFTAILISIIKHKSSDRQGSHSVIQKCRDDTSLRKVETGGKDDKCYVQVGPEWAVECTVDENVPKATLKFVKPSVTEDILVTEMTDRIFGWTQGGDVLKVILNRGMVCSVVDIGDLKLDELKTTPNCETMYEDGTKCYISNFLSKCLIDGPLHLSFPPDSSVNFIPQPTVKGNLAYTRYTFATKYSRTETVEAGKRAALFGLKFSLFGHNAYICEQKSDSANSSSADTQKCRDDTSMRKVETGWKDDKCYVQVGPEWAVECTVDENVPKATLQFVKPSVTEDILVTEMTDHIFGWTQGGVDLKVILDKGMVCKVVDIGDLKLDELKTTPNCKTMYEDGTKCYISKYRSRCLIDGPLQLSFPPDSHVNFIPQPTVKGNLAYTRYTYATKYSRTETVKAGERAALYGLHYSLFRHNAYICEQKSDSANSSSVDIQECSNDTSVREVEKEGKYDKCYFQVGGESAVKCSLATGFSKGSLKFNKPSVTEDILVPTPYDHIFGWTLGEEVLKVILTKGMTCENISIDKLNLDEEKTPVCRITYEMGKRCYVTIYGSRCMIIGPVQLRFRSSSHVIYIRQAIVQGNLAYSRYTFDVRSHTETLEAGERAALYGTLPVEIKICEV